MSGASEAERAELLARIERAGAVPTEALRQAPIAQIRAVLAQLEAPPGDGNWLPDTLRNWEIVRLPARASPSRSWTRPSRARCRGCASACPGRRS